MNIDDEELQNLIEKGNSPIEGMEAEAYKKVFDVLQKEPDFYLPANFADKVIARVDSQKESSKDLLWIVLGVISFVIAAIISIMLTDFKINFGAFGFLNGYPGLVAFGIAFILGIQWLDRKLIRQLLS